SGRGPRGAGLAATGSPRLLSSGGVRRWPWGWDLVPPVGVAGDRHALEPEVFDPVRRDLPPPVGSGQVAAELAPVPSVAGPPHAGPAPPRGGGDRAERPLGHRVPVWDSPPPQHLSPP